MESEPDECLICGDRIRGTEAYREVPIWSLSDQQYADLDGPSLLDISPIHASCCPQDWSGVTHVMEDDLEHEQ